ncbi:excinuclease ABC subunit UvrC [Candidatus Woesearchaeota archaeon]|nr:excinuclease ABC subunit UvrC [Candidatus Woesearchaeota archaeon]
MIDLANIPSLPGCYLFKDSSSIIYIGKAKNLKKRVSSYFSKKHDIKTTKLVDSIRSVSTIVTDNETEALILENTLIRRHKPKYNVDLRNSDRYAYLCFSQETFPRLIVSRSKEGLGKLYGPFTSGQERNNIQRFLIRSLKLRTCNRMRKKGCLRHHIRLCDGPCMGLITKTAYNEKIKVARLILSGKIEDVISRLKKDMEIQSQHQNYEKALEFRNLISALNSISEKQKVERNRKYNEDLVNFKVVGGYVYLLVFKIYKGTLNGMHEFSFQYYDDFLRHFFILYYNTHPKPKELIVPGYNKSILDESQWDDLRLFLKSIGVVLVAPKIGEKKKLLELAEKNIDIVFFGDVSKLDALRIAIKLEEMPIVIECFDISHLSGTSVVGSMVQFRNAKPDKSNYRRFKIRSVEGIDDYAAIAEVVRRRYKRLISENQNLPNLIIIDGGRGQLNAALEELRRIGLRIPIISIAKREEELYLPGLSIPLRLKQDSKDLLFVREIRDEAHRFAIKYNRLLRKKNL